MHPQRGDTSIPLLEQLSSHVHVQGLERRVCSSGEGEGTGNKARSRFFVLLGIEVASRGLAVLCLPIAPFPAGNVGNFGLRDLRGGHPSVDKFS